MPTEEQTVKQQNQENKSGNKKQLYGYFKRKTGDIAPKCPGHDLKGGNLKRKS